MKKPQILDCTLRDGGYYTNWDFDQELVKDYLIAMEKLPVEYLEIGYRSKPMDGYLGEFFYCPKYIFEQVRKLAPSKKTVIILNEKDCLPTDVDYLFSGLENYIDLVRVAVSPDRFDYAIELAKCIKDAGFSVAFNVMYMSKWIDDKPFLEKIHKVNGLVDFFYMVDSFGSVYPNQVKELIGLLKEKVNVPLGFHGHNNLELAHINTLTAIECGCEIVDVTITGMGRGAGNLKTELLLTSLASNEGLEVPFNELSAIVSDFETMQKHYGWGTNLPYMVSGALSQPQKDVMSWISKRTYSINSIITTLQNKNESITDNLKLDNFDFSKTSFKNVLIVGGGPGAVQHKKAIKQYLRVHSNEVCIIHASTKNAGYYKDLDVPQFFCLVGNEGYRMQKTFKNDLNNRPYTCILPPYPRKMGTFIPEGVIKSSYELENVNFTDKFKDSHFALALQTSLEFKVENVYLVGYDGYGENMGVKEVELSAENQYLIDKFQETGVSLVALTETKYNLQKQSVYSYLK